MVNQILGHIGNTPTELVEHSRDNGVVVEGHSPFARGRLLDHELVVDMAGRYDVSVPQLAIRHVLQLDILPLPKTANPDHMRMNADVDFEIADDDMQALQDVADIDCGDASVLPVHAEAG